MSIDRNINANALERRVRTLSRTFFLAISVVSLFIVANHLLPETPPAKEVTEKEEIVEFENGIHIETGLKEGTGLDQVIANCTGCHSASMISQNRATRAGWQEMIVWMQATQGLWDLGDNEPLILDYLAANYAPKKSGRRAPLTNIEWYDLESQ